MTHSGPSSCSIDQDHNPHRWFGGSCPGSGGLRENQPDPMEQLREQVLTWAEGVYPGDYDRTVLTTAELVEQLLQRSVAVPDTLRNRVLAMLDIERDAQDVKFGRQRPPDGTGGDALAFDAETARHACQEAFADGRGTWRHILAEEYAEAMAETKPEKLLAELIQVGAVCVAWSEALIEQINAQHAQ